MFTIKFKAVKDGNYEMQVDNARDARAVATALSSVGIEPEVTKIQTMRFGNKSAKGGVSSVTN